MVAWFQREKHKKFDFGRRSQWPGCGLVVWWSRSPKEKSIRNLILAAEIGGRRDPVKNISNMILASEAGELEQQRCGSCSGCSGESTAAALLRGGAINLNYVLSNIT